MFSFINYLWEIFTVGAKRGVDVDVAFDMFRTDVSLGEAKKSNTGDALPGFDFVAAKAEWDMLTDDEQKAAVEECNDCIAKYYDDLCAEFVALSEAD